MASDEGWMQRLRSPRVAPADAVQMASLPDWHRASQRVAADPKRADKDAEKDGVSRRSISDAEIRPSAEINAKVSLWRGDITTLGGDAIVNAANSSLLGGGGVDGAIHTAAGLDLYKECATLGGCNRGQAKITKGYRLPVKHVIHTVGPLGENPRVLAQCYESCLAFTGSHKIRTLALCGISTGIFGYPPEKAAHIALHTVRKWLERGRNITKIDRIVFVTYTKREARIYEHLLPVYFPPVRVHDDTFDEDGEDYEDGLDTGSFEDVPEPVAARSDPVEKPTEKEKVATTVEHAPAEAPAAEAASSSAAEAPAEHEEERETSPDTDFTSPEPSPTLAPVANPDDPAETTVMSKAERRRRRRQAKKAAASRQQQQQPPQQQQQQL